MLANTTKWTLGSDFLPFHPDASHINPGYRDGWNACHTALAAAIARLLAALDGMDRGCTDPGFCGHENGYGEPAGDELQAAREALELLVGHVAAPDLETN